MEAHRLRAPSGDGAVLAVPPLDEAGSVLADNARTLDAWDHDFQGRRAGRLRALARREVLERANRYHEFMGLDRPEVPRESGRLVVTGHQPELFHPGVWVKNFAVAEIARSLGGDAWALNLIVDDDIPKGPSLRVPGRIGEALRSIPVEFDTWGGEVPYEDWSVRDEHLFASFGDRARAVQGDQVADPILDDFWPRVLRAAGRTDRIGLRFAAARRELEADWGVRNVEVPLSAACETDAFLWFASHLLAQLPRFQEVHNAALDRYRALYHIRSRHHPVPALARDGDWREAPFWAWRAGSPRRRPLLARQVAPGRMQLRIAGEDEVLMEVPLGPDREACCAVEALRTLPERRVRLRTRALTTTLFARFLLGDLFLHGIGGAKYDELGDEVARRFFGIEPPTYLTLSMTQWLGLPADPATPDRLRRVERRIRDLTYNPDRHLPDPADPTARALVESKRAAIDGPTATRRQRIARFEAIRRANDRLRAAVAGDLEVARQERAALLAGLRRNTIVKNREFSFVLHSAGRLRSAMARVAPRALVG